MMCTNLQSFGTSFSITGNVYYGQLRYLSSAPKEKQAPATSAPAISLSRRQEEVLRLLIQGYSNKQIALALKMGQGTVKVHVTALLHKLGVSGRTAAAVAGARLLGAKTPALPAADEAGFGRSHPFGPSHLGVAA